jgi:uncharacterized delta-60 repeat protein
MNASMALVRRETEISRSARRQSARTLRRAVSSVCEQRYELQELEPRRLLSGGFGDHGWTHVDFPAYTNGFGWPTSIMAESDGKIYVAGQIGGDPGEAMGIARFNPDGSLDTTFGSDGSGAVAVPMSDDIVPDHILVQSDGKILVTGESPSGIGIVRLNSDGSIDTNFGGGARIYNIFNGFPADSVEYDDAVWVTSSGDVMLTAMKGPDIVTLRLTGDGNPDVTFAPNGFVTSVLDTNGDPISADNLLAAEPMTDGTVLGYADIWSADSTVQLVQVHLDGSGNILSQKVVDTGLMPGSGNPGYIPDYYLAMNPDGSAFVASAAADPRIAKLSPDGTLDSTFGNGGLVTVPGSYASVLSSTPNGGALVESGNDDTFFTGSANTVKLLNPDGSISSTFNGGKPAGASAFPAIQLADGSTVFAYFGEDSDASFVVEEIQGPTGQEDFNTNDADAQLVIANAQAETASENGSLFTPVDGSTVWNPDGTQDVYADNITAS